MIVARDDAFYGPTVLSVAREYGVPVRALYRVPLAETRVGDWIRLLLEAATDGYPFEPTARLLAHPLGSGMSKDHWRSVRKARPAGPGAWSSAGLPLPETWPHAWPTEDTRAGWLARLDRLLDAHDLGRKTASWREEVFALMNLKNAAAWLAESADEVLPREDFLRELEELLYAANTPAHPEREGVALHTPLALFGARYRHVFTLGLVEGSFPAPAADDPALDYHERGKLRAENGIRLELADERARRERLSFWMLLRVPQERLVLSYPKLVEHRSALPSPYFALLGADPVPPQPLPAASPEEARKVFLRTDGYEDPVLPRALLAWEIERRREGADPFDAYDGVTGVPLDHASRRFSVSELGTWRAAASGGGRDPSSTSASPRREASRRPCSGASTTRRSGAPSRRPRRGSGRAAPRPRTGGKRSSSACRRQPRRRRSA